MQTQIRRWLLIWTLFSTHCKVLNGMTNERVKTLPATELDHFWSTEFVFNEQTQETWTRAQASNNFQLLTRNCPEWKEASNCYRERRRGLTLSFTETASSLTVYMFEWFSQQATLTFLRYKSFLKSCLYSTWFMFIEFVCKLVVACSFLVACVIKALWI